MDDRRRASFDESPVRLDRQDPYLRLQSVTVFVRDLDRSLDFFVNKLGFQLIFDARILSGRPFVAVAPPDGTANLTLVAPAPASEQFKLIGRHTQIAFITEDVLAKFRDWSRRGVSFQVAPRLRRLKHGLPVRVTQDPGLFFLHNGTRSHLGWRLCPLQGSRRQYLFPRQFR